MNSSTEKKIVLSAALRRLRFDLTDSKTWGNLKTVADVREYLVNRRERLDEIKRFSKDYRALSLMVEVYGVLSDQVVKINDVSVLTKMHHIEAGHFNDAKRAIEHDIKIAEIFLTQYE